MLGFASIDRALATRPDWFINVTDTQYERLEYSRTAGTYTDDIEMAWATGQRFLQSVDGLRGRVPDRLEWKGPKKPPGWDQIPADLQVDHVYLISCKYGSNILLNTSPPRLFERHLAERSGDKFDWYARVAPEAFQALYEASCEFLDERNLPDSVTELTNEQRLVLKNGLPKGSAWPEPLQPVYQDFVNAVSQTSAQQWLSTLTTERKREEMVWRLLRLEPAPYFVLGTSVKGTPLHFRVNTPSEFRQDFRLRSFDSWNPVLGQPAVQWRADVVRRETNEITAVEGHIEIRWSQGRFAGFPEAKVYLDTPHHEVPGYVPLA